METNGTDNIRTSNTTDTEDNAIQNQHIIIGSPADKKGYLCQNDCSMTANKPNNDDQQIPQDAAENDKLSMEKISLQDDQTSSTPTHPTSSKLNGEKHHLRNKWTFYYVLPHKNLDWFVRLKDVCTVSSVEQFWAFIDNIRPPSGLQSNADYNFFKEGIRPEWEDEQNKIGGRLIVQVDKGRNDWLDNFWLELLLALIGEQFGSDSDQICGAVCNIRQKGSKICLWTKNAQTDDVNKRIGSVLKDRFEAITDPVVNVRVTYEEHHTGQPKSSSAIQSRFHL